MYTFIDYNALYLLKGCHIMILSVVWENLPQIL